jgi:hypothetical protein
MPADQRPIRDLRAGRARAGHLRAVAGQKAHRDGGTAAVRAARTDHLEAGPLLLAGRPRPPAELGGTMRSVLAGTASGLPRPGRTGRLGTASGAPVAPGGATARAVVVRAATLVAVGRAGADLAVPTAGRRAVAILRDRPPIAGAAMIAGPDRTDGTGPVAAGARAAGNVRSAAGVGPRAQRVPVQREAILRDRVSPAMVPDLVAGTRGPPAGQVTAARGAIPAQHAIAAGSIGDPHPGRRPTPVAREAGLRATSSKAPSGRTQRSAWASRRR